MKKTLILLSCLLTPLAAAQSAADIQNAIEGAKHFYGKAGILKLAQDNPGFAGHWFENGKTHLYLKAGSPALQSQGSGVKAGLGKMGIGTQGAVTHTVKYSFEQLMVFEATLIAYASRGKDIKTVRINLGKNQVEVGFHPKYTSAEKEAQFQQFIKNQQIPQDAIRVLPKSEVPVTKRPGGKGDGSSTPPAEYVDQKVRPFLAGIQYNTTNNMCSIGYMAEMYGTKGFVTARHCFKRSSDGIAVTQGGENIGIILAYKETVGPDAMFVMLTNQNYKNEIAVTEPASNKISMRVIQNSSTSTDLYASNVNFTGRTTYTHRYQRGSQFYNITAEWDNDVVDDFYGSGNTYYRTQGRMYCLHLNNHSMYHHEFVQGGDSGGTVFNGGNQILGITTLMTGSFRTTKDGQQAWDKVCYTPVSEVETAFAARAVSGY